MQDINIRKQLFYFAKKWLDKKAGQVDQRAIVKHMYSELEPSAGFFLVLTTSNMIALAGLITNSMPVIIGAMLISPLMGPILNAGFAFVTGDGLVWRKSARKIAMSVLLTVAIAAVATYISPLKDITNEVLIRTRPNLYDLIIAVLCGLVGAAAICTKKNYMTVVPGVAIATAVIPPLSVTGFGIGILNFKVALGGFFLFFTNFVAIIIATCIVFFFYGFRPDTETKEGIVQLKRRVAALGALLFLISIPLFYTLHISIGEVRTRAKVQAVLKSGFDLDKISHLSSFNCTKNKDGGLDVSAVVNTVKYLSDPVVKEVEKAAARDLGESVSLYVEQVLVQPGGLKEQVAMTPAVTQAPAFPQAPTDVMNTSRGMLLAALKGPCAKVGNIIAPAELTDYYVGFSDKGEYATIHLKMKRDEPLPPGEELLIKRMLADSLGVPVELKVETEPFFRPLVFDGGKTGISDEMKKELSGVKAVCDRGGVMITVKAYPDSSRGARLAERRAKAVADYLVHDCNVPENNVRTVVEKRAFQKKPTVEILVSAAEDGRQDVDAKR